MSMPQNRAGRSDDELLRLIQQGDDRAFRETFDRYANVCFSAAMSLLKSRELCIDVVVEIFRDVRANAAEIKDLKAYIFERAKQLTRAGLHEIARKYFEENESHEHASADHLSRSPGKG